MFDLREESELQQNLGFALEPLLGSFGPRIGRYYYETLLMDELGEEDERISFLGAVDFCGLEANPSEIVLFTDCFF